MAETLSKTIKAASLVLSIALLGSAPAAAQTLTDPTRPPPSLAAPRQEAGGTPAAPVLQSVMIGARRAQAIINGQTVQVGDRVGDARVATISEAEVVLRSGKNTQTLRLFPGIEKRPVAGRGVSSPAAGTIKR